MTEVIETKKTRASTKKTAESEITTDLGAFEMQPVICRMENDSWKPELKYFRLFQDVERPVYGTEKSFCFDLSAYLGEHIHSVTVYDSLNVKQERKIRSASWERYVIIQPGDRVLVPTGLIFDLPEDSVMKLFPRSGLSLKNGLNLANNVAIIDEDYVEQVFVALHNTSNVTQHIFNGIRIAQASVETRISYQPRELAERPAHKTSRVGGFGSTGT